MRTRILVACLLVSSCLLPGARAWADAAVSDWIGEYSMNHDGHVGTLRIRDQKVDCAAPPWCGLVLDYIDSSGNRSTGSIQSIDQKGQHMRFVIGFPNNRQVFNGWIFSWDKNHVAGTTEWGGRTFGFYAAKREGGQP